MGGRCTMRSFEVLFVGGSGGGRQREMGACVRHPNFGPPIYAPPATLYTHSSTPVARTAHISFLPSPPHTSSKPLANILSPLSPPPLPFPSLFSTGSTGGFNDSADRDLPFTAVHEPATLPRVQEIVIISEHSPWCTIVKNEDGVTLGDICNQMWKECVSSSSPISPSALPFPFTSTSTYLDVHFVSCQFPLVRQTLTFATYSYTEHNITEAEFTAVPARLQETIKRANAVNGGWGGPGQFYSPAPNPGRYRRVGTWLFFLRLDLLPLLPSMPPFALRPSGFWVPFTVDDS